MGTKPRKEWGHERFFMGKTGEKTGDAGRKLGTTMCAPSQEPNRNFFSSLMILKA